MGWLHKVLKGDVEQESDALPAPLDPADLVPPPLPKLASHDPAADHARTYASKVCPSCGAPVKPLPRETVTCESCAKPIVVLAGEDGQWHLLREAKVKAFDAEQEQIRAASYAADEAARSRPAFSSATDRWTWWKKPITRTCSRGWPVGAPGSAP